MKINILSWNIRQGGGSRVAKILKNIKDQKSEILVFSEFRNNTTGNLLRNGLLNLGYRHQLASNALASENSVLIASMIPFNGEIHSKIDPVYSNNILTAHFEAFSVIGVYLPHKKKHILFDFILERAKSDTPYIIAGDYNSGKNFVDQIGNSFWYMDDIISLEKQGYHDAFRHLHADRREYSWYSHQGKGYRYDHTYVAGSLLPIVQSCFYLHEWREGKLSDHSPMVLGLGV